ncbi:formate dehydrogenase accessory protein [Aquisphaera giovannonii]|uniref:Sulfur carrier protein FdhD n=1 Tax=Aquisphaera giovannonii TaxID=406548 RepID=A0A5B9VTA7_9BACT|nr:formate dehydrogenase accessory sulfurtransferase FdhD [Aquisphaera giovannonii]QEH31736.1 formate dehydrogenase accessory protein [Aquisphaera giovannonii]
MPATEEGEPKPSPALALACVGRVEGGGVTDRPDALAVEEPLEIRLGLDADGRRSRRAISVTMRTPGHDEDLAVGYLFTEGLLERPGQVAGVRPCRSGSAVRVDLRPGVAIDLARLERRSFASSSCGACGKTSLEAVGIDRLPMVDGPGPVVDPAVVRGLPGALRASQPTFDRTGGLHACALFDPSGRLLSVREDVGRHNALDKLIGAEFRAGRAPLSGAVLLLSGRVGFELVQKAAMAGIPVVAAIGAPSSLAVAAAGACGMTLLGFVRDDRFNIYSGAARVAVGGRSAR